MLCRRSYGVLLVLVTTTVSSAAAIVLAPLALRLGVLQDASDMN